MDREALQQLIDDDDLGLLDVKPVLSAAQTAEERLIEKFYKISDFYRAHDREPRKAPEDMQEAQLAMTLEGIRSSHESIATLKALDEFGLLEPPVVPESLDDVFADDDLGLLSEKESAEDIFRLKHVPQRTELPDFVAQREPCPDFDRFEPLFKACQRELRAGKRQLLSFANEQQIEAGQFFVLRGVMAYVASVGEKEIRGGKNNARLRLIFENGTESDMLLRSLATELYKDGRRVTEHEDRLIPEMAEVTEEDKPTGYIYVLRSKSAREEIANEPNLYKIGFSAGPIEARIKNAREDPTYLMADVQIVTSFECYNLNPQKLELILHKFFGRVCLEVDVFDKSGKRHTPREWFIAPLAVIEEAIRLTLTGEIIDFTFDKDAGLIRKKWSMSKPVAVIDVGSNSIKLLVAACDDDHGLKALFTETIETRISKGIGNDLPNICEASIEEGCKTVAELVRIAREYDPGEIAIVATSAVRDALNGQDFIDCVFEKTGIRMRVLSGIEEATYIGQGLACDPQLAGAENFIQMDIGGGSLELIRFKKARISQVRSLRLGAVRLSERFVTDRDAPISRHVETAINAFVRAELAQCDFGFAPKNDPLIATGGAFVVSRAILAAEKGQKIEEHYPVLKFEALEKLKNKLCALALHERMAVPHLPAARADIIPAALITILALLKHADRRSLTHSFCNLRYGLAAELLH
ncbi:MAG TPA: GIY-YIG nuclease family protein [Opitutales bacterium]|nr:GIY-YIG nuclease family protein [Opitutales bacterium]